MAELESTIPGLSGPTHPLPPSPSAPPHSPLSCCQAETAGLVQSFGWGRAGQGLWRAGGWGSNRLPAPAPPNLWLWLVSSQRSTSLSAWMGHPKSWRQMGNQAYLPAADASWDWGLKAGTPRAQRPFLHLFASSAVRLLCDFQQVA